MSDTIVIDGADITVLPARAHALVVHDASRCSGEVCVVHNATNHSMRSLPLVWRGDRNLFERTCSHGIGHPDPDQASYWRKVAERGDITDEVYVEDDEDDEFVDQVVVSPDEYVAAQMIHGCDGCCGGAS